MYTNKVLVYLFIQKTKQKMDNQKSSSTQVMLNYGLILGVVSVLTAVANFAFGNVYKPHWSISVVSAVLSIVVIVLGLKAIKQNKFHGVDDGLSFERIYIPVKNKNYKDNWKATFKINNSIFA